MVREIAGTMPMYARVTVGFLVLLAGGYRIAQELRLFRCGCSCCLSDATEDTLVFDGTDVPVRYLLNHMDRIYNLFALVEDHP